jgi:hypothetical protein
MLPPQTLPGTESAAHLMRNDDNKSNLSEDETVIFHGREFTKSPAIYKTNNDKDEDMQVVSEPGKGNATPQTKENLVVDIPTGIHMNQPNTSVEYLGVPLISFS